MQAIVIAWKSVSTHLTDVTSIEAWLPYAVVIGPLPSPDNTHTDGEFDAEPGA